MRKTAICLAAVSGFTAMAAQIIIIREFMIAFSGDELSVGLVLCSWLAGGAVGSMLLRNLAQNLKAKVPAIWSCQAFISVYLPLSIFLIRSIRGSINAVAGQTLPFYVLLASSLILLLPVCAALGFLFPLLCRAYKEGEDGIAGGIAKIYAFEAFGSMVGGLSASFILIKITNPFQSAAILSIINILTSLFLTPYFKKKALVIVTGFFIFSGFIYMSFSGAWAELNRYSIEKQWAGYKLLETRNTIYENLIAFKRGVGQISFFGNGIRLHTVPDRQSSEEKVNFCLLEHGSPDDILLVGGGAGGLLKDILAHPVKSVTYLELDPGLVDMARRFLPEEYSASFNDRRVEIVNADARYFVKNSARKYDCIILDAGEPYNAFVNRFYTAEFFKELRFILKPGGIVSFGISASESYINTESADYLRSLYVTLKSAFPEVITIPGETVYFVASDGKGLTYDYNILMERAKNRSINLQYVREYYLSDRLSPGKIDYLQRVLHKEGRIMLNLDFRPASYYYGIISWSSRFAGSRLTRFMRAADLRSIIILFSVLLIAVILFCTGRIKNTLLTALAIGGFSQSVFQVMLIFSFQVLYGYLFYKIGLLFAFFMLGLFLSGWKYSRAGYSISDARECMLRAQGAAVLFSASVPLILYIAANARSPIVVAFGSNIIFPLFASLAGFIEGYLFSSVNHVYLSASADPGRAKIAGLTYGWDLAGACLGAAICAVFLIPIAGIAITCIMLSVLNLLAFIMLFRGND